MTSAGQAEEETPEFWRQRCGMPKLDQFPIRCWRGLGHDEGHVGRIGGVVSSTPVRWPGLGSLVPLCYRGTYRCWCPGNQPGQQR